MEMGIYFVAGMFTGFFIAFLLTFRTKPKKTKPEMYQTPKIIEKSKLHHITLKTAISRDRFDPDHPEEILDFAKTRLARQFNEIMETQIQTEPDYVHNCLIFKLSFWVKEAAGEKIDY